MRAGKFQPKLDASTNDGLNEFREMRVAISGTGLGRSSANSVIQLVPAECPSSVERASFSCLVA